MTLIGADVGSAIKGLTKIILCVQDMPLMASFYRDKLGLDVLHPVGVDDLTGEQWVVMSTGQCSVALESCGRRVATDARSPVLVFGVEDLETVRGRLIQQGIEMSEPEQVPSGALISDGVDPEGNRFELQTEPSRA